MKKTVKPTVALAGLCWGISAFFSQTASAQSIMGTSILAPATAPTGGIALNSEEYLVVDWTVTFNAGLYDYSYVVNNPANDVLLNNDGSLTTTTEIVDAFQIGFNTTIP